MPRAPATTHSGPQNRDTSPEARPIAGFSPFGSGRALAVPPVAAVERPSGSVIKPWERREAGRPPPIAGAARADVRAPGRSRGFGERDHQVQPRVVCPRAWASGALPGAQSLGSMDGRTTRKFTSATIPLHPLSVGVLTLSSPDVGRNTRLNTRPLSLLCRVPW
jgi:hypothetical protein